MNGILVDDDEDDPTKYLVYEIIKNINVNICIKK